jgi:hypothetical protein
MVTRRVSEALTAIPRLRFGLPLNQQALTRRVGINADYISSLYSGKWLGGEPYWPPSVRLDHQGSSTPPSMVSVLPTM